MNYPITLIWSFRNRLTVFEKSILTAHNTCPLSVNFCLVDAASDESTIKKLRLFCNSIKGRKIRICESAYRTTVSEAWNLGIMLSDTRYVVIVSSDVVFNNGTWFVNIQKMIRDCYEYVLVDNHAVFMIDKKIIPQIGWFDESYALGPHFDTDYMIKASEGKVELANIPNDNSYFHGDTESVFEARKKTALKDRLPMNKNTNDIVFKKKWKTSWPGWQNRIHPPTHISQVTRLLPEIDPHPFFTQKYKTLYKNSLYRKLVKKVKRTSARVSRKLSRTFSK